MYYINNTMNIWRFAKGEWVMLEIQNLTKKYGHQLAVDHVSFTVPGGQVGILLGPNGAGKSTIIKSIAGLLRYEGGVGIEQMPARALEAKRIFAVLNILSMCGAPMIPQLQMRGLKSSWPVLNWRTNKGN